MSRVLILVGLVVAGVVPALLATACSSSSSAAPAASCGTGGADGGACTPGQTTTYVTCADLSSPTVSFGRDIQPTFNRSCGIAGSTCHGDPNNNGGTNGQIFLGLPDGGTDAAQVLAAIVGQPSPEDPELNIIQAHSPSDSYLMHKLDDDQCQFAKQCNATNNPIWSAPQGTPCGYGMPYQSPILDTTFRDTVRRWIAQGAQNN